MTIETPAIPAALPHGIYCPTITFFRPTAEQELDLDVYKKHVEFLARSGIQGVVVLGSTGEAVTLSNEESTTLIRIANEVFKQISPRGVVVAGTAAAQSTREAIQLARDAAKAGADFALVLPPSYYPGAMTPAAIQAFYEEVADASPLPVIIYSYPAVSSGIVMDSDLIRRLAKHPRIVGVKHTDHEVSRIAREASIETYGSPFTIVGGASDYLIGTLAVGGKGAITGMANITPRVLAKVYELVQAGQQLEALKLAGLISRSEWAIGKGGILGTKYAIQWASSYPASAALARRPLPLVSEATKQNIEHELAEVVAYERQLEKDGYVGLALKSVERNGVELDNNDARNGLIDALKHKVAGL